MVHKPDWFRDGEVFMSFAPTSGINKDGADLFKIDPASGERTKAIDDLLSEDVTALLEGKESVTARWVPIGELTERLLAVPVYFDDRPRTNFNNTLESSDYEGFAGCSIGDLIDEEILEVRVGHGSPSADLRNGSVPYIKVSDIRAGQVNINPSNQVPEVVARRFWKGEDSGLRPFDLVTPMRSSKNIGEFALLMPGQERVVLTKEILVIRPTKKANFDAFYLFWALTLSSVRDQWHSLVFMQTNREDVGLRYREVVIPIAPDSITANARSKAFRNYYEGMQQLRHGFMEYLALDGLHHVFLGEEIEAEQEDYEKDEL